MLLIIEPNLKVTLVSGSGDGAIPKSPAPARARSKLSLFRFPLESTENNNYQDTPHAFDLSKKQAQGSGCISGADAAADGLGAGAEPWSRRTLKMLNCSPKP